MKFKNIIFDFDGTLVDTRPGIVNSFKKAVKELTEKEIEEQEIVELIGRPLVQIMSILLNTNNQVIINQGSELFKKYYSGEGFSQNVVYPNIEKMLLNFKNQSRRLFVTSNKIELFMNKILEQHNFKKYFIFICGTDGADSQSKKTENVKKLITRYKLKKKETVIVGDTENDILAGKENQIYSIGVTWGYGLESNLIKATADTICHTPLELGQFIRKY